MQARYGAAGLLWLACIVSAAAQTQAVTNNNDGVSGTIPVYTGASTVGNSHISVADGIVRVEGYSSGFWSVGQPLWQAWKMLDSTNNNSELFRIGATNLVPNWIVGSGNGWPINLTGGNVGVGYPNMPPGMSGSNTFNVNGTSYFSGNVGIGMTAPQYPLDVAGQIHSSGGIVFPDGSIQTSALASSGSGAITQLNGNVGIGTTSPTAPLHVLNTQTGNTDIRVENDSNSSSGGQARFVAVSDAGSAEFGITNSEGPYGGNAFIWNSANTALMFATSSYERMRIDKSGNVGIGTTSPGTNLEVNNVIKLTNSGSSNGGDGNDGKISAGTFGPGLNLVGIATQPASYRKISLWGEITQQQNNGTNTWIGTNYFNGNVGIGITAPTYPLDVAGQIHSSSGIVFPDGSIQTTATPGLAAGSSNAINQSNGNVGIGTTTPLGALQVASGNGNLIFKTIGGQPDSYVYEYLLLFQVPTSGTSNETAFNGSICAVRGDELGVTSCANLYAGFGWSNSIYFSENITKAGYYGALQPVQVSYAGSNWVALLYDCHLGACANSWVVNGTLLNDNVSSVVGFTAESTSSPIHTALSYNPTNMAFMYGNIGVGTTNPDAKLEVAGNIKLTANSGGSITFPDGSVQTVAYTGVTCGADYAEAVDVTGDRTKYEPGDILVLDPHVPGKFLKSNQAYSTLVAGIYSTKPGFVGRKQPATPETNATEVPMAMVGRVPTKVTTENGSIQVGDLLVASSAVGYAMKGTDRSRLTGAVIGKAMGNLASGSGVIEVLVTLQ